MKTSVRIVTILLTVSLGFMWSTDAAWGQRRGRGRGDQRSGERAGSARSRLPSPEFDTMPFDVTREQLPPVYLGHNIQLLYNSIKNTPAKGGGEGANAPFARVFAFQVKPVEKSYNARDNSLQVYCPLSDVLVHGSEDSAKRGLRILHIPQMDNHFTYTDAKGSKIEIAQVKFTDYTIAFANYREFPVQGTMPPGIKQAPGYPGEGMKAGMVAGTLKVTPREAPQLEESISVLAVCDLTEPYTSSETVQREGTKEKPGEYLAEHHYLYVRLRGLWFYDFVTGKVLMKVSPGEVRGN